jgi:hypothetical protein
MDGYTKCGLVLLCLLMTLSIGLVVGQKDIMNKIQDPADVKENEPADKNVETTEDNDLVAGSNQAITNAVIIDNVSYGNNQWVELKNNANSVQDLTGWMLAVQNKTAFTFPTFMLDATATVKIHSGVGMDSKTDLYANNTLFTKANDEVSLLDVTGTVVSTSEEPKEKSDQPNDA